MYKSLFVILFVFFLNSCEKPIDIELPVEESKLVISSNLESNKYWNNGKQYLYVSNSITGLGAISDYHFTDSIPVIGDANVKIFHINNLNEVSNEYQFNFNNNCYCYTNQDFIPEENQTYKLNVVYDNYPEVNAFETIPAEVDYSISDFEMNDILDQEIEGQLCKLNISLKDSLNVQNFYKLKIIAVNTFEGKSESCNYSISDPSFLIPINDSDILGSYYNGNDGYFTDELFDGETKTLSIDVEKPSGAFEFFYIRLISLSGNYYMFNLTKKKQNEGSNNLIFNNEPMFIHSNIENGYGIFRAKAITGKAYIPTYYPIHGWLDY